MKNKKINLFVELISIILVIFTLVGVATLVDYLILNKNEQALQSYRGAVEFCGIDNLKINNYSDGTTDFTCKDYSRVK